MRDRFISTLFKESSRYPEMILLTGDLGFGVFDEFKEKRPGQFLNVGVAEQNMTGLATGMSLVGRNVFTYSIGNFPTLRCLEQIRNDAAYHNANVTIVSIGAGFSYGQLGMSHHATEDLGIMRSIPQITIFSPATLWEVEEATLSALKINGTCYIRLDKSYADEGDVISNEFKVGYPRLVRSGDMLTIVCTGGVMGEILKATETLAESGINVDLFSCHTISPFYDVDVIDSLIRTKKLLIVEEHSLVGGLSSLMSERIVDKGVPFECCEKIGITPDKFCSIVGDQHYLRSAYGLDSQAITKKIAQIINC